MKPKLACRRLFVVFFVFLIVLSSTAAADLSHSAAEVTEEFSCNSSVASVSNHKPPPPANFRYEFRRLATRYRSEISKFDEPLEVSENSCVESCSGANDVRELKLKSANVEETEAGGEVSKSEVSSAPPRFSLAEKDVVRVRGNENSVLEIVRDDVVSEYNNESLLESDSVSVDNSAFYLACSEKFSNGAIIGDGDEEESEQEKNSTSSGSFVEALFDLAYTPSIGPYTSGSQFSEADEKCSPCFLLFSQFKQQLCRSTVNLAASTDYCAFFEYTVTILMNSVSVWKILSKKFVNYKSNCCIRLSFSLYLLGLVDEEVEKSYRMIMKRERGQVYLGDYAEEYCNTTDYGHLVIQQRLHKVNWIVEQATNRTFQTETIFLGVRFLDRFRAKGYFENMRDLQIAGIACLTLATRIKENQPYNCIRTETFYVGWAAYGWSEVVAIEWLVQEVLNFRCFLPTLYLAALALMGAAGEEVAGKGKEVVGQGKEVAGKGKRKEVVGEDGPGRVKDARRGEGGGSKEEGSGSREGDEDTRQEDDGYICRACYEKHKRLTVLADTSNGVVERIDDSYFRVRFRAMTNVRSAYEICYGGTSYAILDCESCRETLGYRIFSVSRIVQRGVPTSDAGSFKVQKDEILLLDKGEILHQPHLSHKRRKP
ncbi:hypothetical protein ACJIZ3_020565 [Penstemon smallii]|uniref:Cyclin N-terminal domain-containing protein n=1 Tax=Penstemon smallii TaxID=265156 RepID=A0ABD3SJH1_9LAMI